MTRDDIFEELISNFGKDAKVNWEEVADYVMSVVSLYKQGKGVTSPEGVEVVCPVHRTNRATKYDHLLELDSDSNMVVTDNGDVLCLICIEKNQEEQG